VQRNEKKGHLSIRSKDGLSKTLLKKGGHLLFLLYRSTMTSALQKD